MTTQVPYENEVYFETQNDSLIEMKNIFESRLFWERISSFFEIQVRNSEIELLNSFYKVPLSDLLSKLQLSKVPHAVDNTSLQNLNIGSEVS